MTEETEVALPTVHVAAAIIQRDGLILAARRAHGMDGWEFPGGKVEPGETSEEACRREVTEELGCKLQVMWLLDTLAYDYLGVPPGHGLLCMHVGTGDRARRKASERKELRWRPDATGCSAWTGFRQTKELIERWGLPGTR